MINAAEALQLPSAQPSKSDINDCRAMVAKLRDHIVKHMTLNGPPTLTVPYSAMSLTASKLLAHAMKPLKWNVNLNLFSEQARFQGGAPVPHHWTVDLQPMPEIYDEVFAATLAAVLEAPADA